MDAINVVALGVIASLIAAGVLWFFRARIGAFARGLDMSAGALLGWLMAFVVLAAHIVFTLIGEDIPFPLSSVLLILVVYLLMSTVARRP